MAAPQEIQTKTNIWSSNSTSGCLSKKMKTLIKKDICSPHIHCRVNRSQDKETTSTPINGSMNKENIPHTDTGILFCHKKNAILPLPTTSKDGPREYCAKWNKPDRKR